MAQYRCRHFALHELLPPHVFQERRDAGWELLDDRLLQALDRLRERYGPMTVNNYHWGGPREWSGLRTPDSPFYSRLSQHSFGRAADCLFANTTAEHVRQDILATPNAPTFQLINSIELNVSWLHFDVRNCDRVKTY